MTDVEHLYTSLRTDEQAGPALIETWVRRWWPFIALVLGIAFTVAGAILFSP